MITKEEILENYADGYTAFEPTIINRAYLHSIGFNSGGWVDLNHMAKGSTTHYTFDYLYIGQFSNEEVHGGNPYNIDEVTIHNLDHLTGIASISTGNKILYKFKGTK